MSGVRDVEYLSRYFGITKEKAENLISNGFNVEFIKNNKNIMHDELNDFVDEQSTSLRNTAKHIEESAEGLKENLRNSMDEKSQS